MPRKTRAIVFPRAGEVEFREFDLPECGPDEIVAETLYTMVSTGTEIRYWAGLYNSEKHFPFIPGYSAVARVIEVGRNVAGFATGDLVSGRNPIPVPGINQRWGAQASHHRYEVSGQQAALKLPAGAKPLDYLLVEVAAISLRGVSHAGVARDDKAVVLGQGLIGALSAHWLQVMGARTVVMDALQARLDWATARGVAGAVLATRTDAVDAVRTILDGGADVVVEASGVPEAAANAIRLLRSVNTADRAIWPRLVLQANYVKPIQISNLYNFSPSQAVSILCPADRQTEDRQRVIEFVQRGKLNTDDFVGRVVPVADAAAAYRALRDQPDQYFSVAFDWTA